MNSIPEKLLKPYNPKETEQRIYKTWEDGGFFNPEKNITDGYTAPDAKPFTIIMPPPNANGHLHAGHALFITLEDIMIRYKRMRGFRTLWVPGADHAGFETQIVYEKKLEKEGRSRFKMEPAQLYKEIMDFTLENKKFMEAEVRNVGASCDWTREKFTLDPSVIAEVHKTFKKMYDDGLAYRGTRLVNWCTKHQTSLSDVETESKEFTDTLYYLQYGPLVVATVRPETIFGDVAVAVHPADARYKKYIDTEIEVTIPTGTLKLKVVADDIVDPEFGTGALKITPAHDKNDFELAARHNLPSISVIDQFGKLTEKAGKYSGLKIAEARKKVVEDLEAMGLIVKKEPYVHSVPVCYKCETAIEPRLIPQWFIKMKPLADLALQAVQDKKLNFIPDNYQKIFTYWMENPIDWNISRQIVWGISIPAKLCEKCDFGAPDLEDKLAVCPKCGSAVRKDTDTFDTWFSSGQWPLITLGFPDSADFKTYYPTDVMETGSDLIFKWVPRMVIFGLYLAKDVPFKDVYLHGLVNDAQGKKMSKSKGNVIDPKTLTDKYGTDALRIGLIVGNTPGSSFALSEDKIKGYKHFANKIWNIARFVLTSTADMPENAAILKDDQVLIDALNTQVIDITKDIEEYRFYMAAEKIYHYIWSEFADVILEQSKPILVGTDIAAKNSRQQTLLTILTTCLKVLHPFMPFVTEELWSAVVPNSSKMLIVEKWPIIQ